MIKQTEQTHLSPSNSIELESSVLTWSMVSLIGLFMVFLVVSYQPEQQQVVHQPPAKPVTPAGFDSHQPPTPQFQKG